MSERKELQEIIFDMFDDMPVEAQVLNTIQLIRAQQVQIDGLMEAIKSLTIAIKTMQE